MIKGHVLVSRIRFLEQQHGRDGVEQVLEALPEEDRAQLAELRPDRWYPFPTVRRLDRAMARVLSPDDSAILERAGEASAREWSEWTGANSALISVHSFLSRAVERQREIQSFGAAAYRRLGFTEGEVILSEHPEVDELWCRWSLGFLRASVRTLSATEVRVEEVACQSRGDAACVFHLRWEDRPS